MVTSNRYTFAKEAIDSILAQTMSDFEFIIINNNSSDNTEELILSYAKADSRICYHKSAKRMPAAKAYNLGISMAKAKYVMIQHDDDIAYPERMRLQYEHMLADPNMGVCGGYRLCFGAHKGLFKVPPERYLREALLSFNPYPDAIAMYNKELMDAHNIHYNEGWVSGYDHKLFCGIAAVAQIGVVEQPILHYRFHPQQISETSRIDYSEKEGDRTHLEYFNTLGLALSADEEELLLHWVLDVQRYKRNEQVTPELYARVAALIEKILQYNATRQHWNQDNLKLVLSHLWRKGCFRYKSYCRDLFTTAESYQIYRYSIPSLDDILEGRLKFYLFKIRRLLKIEGLDLS
jgi:glycosyltransferase involved in cell wall biosynthesis